MPSLDGSAGGAFMQRGLAAFVAVAVLASSLALSVDRAAGATLDSLENDLVVQVNAFRASKGLAQLKVSDTLTQAAKWMSTDMAVKDYFGHTSSDGRSPTQRMADAGYPAYQTWSGEDLAAGYASAREALQGWIDSPMHYAVLVNPNYRAIGVGRAYGLSSDYGWYWTADFGGIVDAPTTVASFDLGFHASWAGQSPSVTLAPGATTTLVVALENTGYRGWYAGSPGQQAFLGTADPLDIPRSDLASGWLSPSRPATQTTSYVGPGQTGWFQFAVRAPSTAGTYRLALRGVIDGTTWLEDAGIFFTITVR